MSEMSENFRGVGHPRAEFNFASTQSGVPTPTVPQEKISREYCKCARKLTFPLVTVGAGKKSDESSVIFASSWTTMPHVAEASLRVRGMRIKFFSRRTLGGAKNPTFPTSVAFEVIASPPPHVFAHVRRCHVVAPSAANTTSDAHDATRGKQGDPMVPSLRWRADSARGNSTRNRESLFWCPTMSGFGRKRFTTRDLRHFGNCPVFTEARR
jgi:hypothetical protein